MEEQPVAFAITARSPNNCETSFTYGVSPHPAHAPLNSNNGRSNCEFLIVDGLISLRSKSGIDMKKSQFFASCSRRGGCGTMLRALRPTCDLSLTGQTSTHKVQPVQSSGALAALNAQVSLPDRDLQCKVAFLPLRCAGREGAIHRKCRHWNSIAVKTDDGPKHIAHEFRRFVRDRSPARDLRSDLSRNLDLI